MGCFQTEVDVVVLVALANVAIAAWTALMPQYAFIPFVAAVLYFYLALQLFRPLCEWPRHYYAVYAAGGTASAFAYIYAWNRAAEHSAGVWAAIQLTFILLTASLTSIAYMVALRRLLPPKERRHPPLPASWNPLDRSIEMLAAADDACAADMPHGGLKRLICRGDASAAGDLPTYALIVATYYALFRRRDFSLAENLVRVLKSRRLAIEESFAVEVLEAAYRAAAACDVRALCRTPATGLSALLKELIALHFAYDAKAAERLKCKAAKAFPVQYDDGRRTVYAPNPLLYFIFHAADRAKQFPACQPRAQ